MGYRFIPTKSHGVIDYIIALVLIFAPTIFQFSSAGDAAVVVPMTTGIVLFVYSLFTDYEWGVFKLVSASYHSIIDALAGVFLILSPFFSQFADKVWWPHVVAGIVLILAALFSETTARRPVTPAM